MQQQQLDWASLACGAALLPLSWLASQLWQARKNRVTPNRSAGGHKVLDSGPHRSEISVADLLSLRQPAVRLSSQEAPKASALHWQMSSFL